MVSDKSSRVERLEAALASSEQIAKEERETRLVETEKMREEMMANHSESIKRQEITMEKEMERMKRDFKQRIQQTGQETTSKIETYRTKLEVREFYVFPFLRL